MRGSTSKTTSRLRTTTRTCEVRDVQAYLRPPESCGRPCGLIVSSDLFCEQSRREHYWHAVCGDRQRLRFRLTPPSKDVVAVLASALRCRTSTTFLRVPPGLQRSYTNSPWYRVTLTISSASSRIVMSSLVPSLMDEIGLDREIVFDKLCGAGMVSQDLADGGRRYQNRL